MKSKVVKIIKAVAIVILILGFISGIVWVVFGNSSYTLINFGFMIAIWIGSGLSALIFGWLAYVLEALINIEDNTRGAKVSADTYKPLDDNIKTDADTIYKPSIYSGNYIPNDTNKPSENEWKCPKCGKINQNYVGTCGCGEIKPN